MERYQTKFVHDLLFHISQPEGLTRMGTWHFTEQVAHRENADGSTSRESAKDNERQSTEMLEEYHFDCANLQYEYQL